MADEILVEDADGVRLVTINRPAARNSVNRAVALGLAAAFDELDERADLTLAILTGADGSFSAGMDLKAFLTGEDPTVAGKGFAGFCAAPPRKPLIAAVEGWALAGGAEMALACDLIVAANNATFGLPEVKRGLVAAGGGLLRLPRRIPPAIAMELALTGDRLSAAEAHRWGLVNALSDPGGALAAARALAARIAGNGPLAVAATKDVVAHSPDWTMDEAWDKQNAITRPVFSSKDAQEGALAFAEKRPPVWTGS